MAICKFFLQGDCRFGENCRFEHQLNPEKAGNQFGNIQNQNKILNPKTGTEIELSTLLNSVKNDVVSGENGKQWLLSCYAPFKEKPLYPGIVDMSFEEVRFGYIEAQKSNTLEQYNQKLQQLLTEAKMRYKSLENPTKEIVELLKNIYNNNLNTENNSMFRQNPQENGTLKGLFGINASAGFGQQNSLAGRVSIFGQQNASQNNFGQQNGSVFGQSSPSIKGGSIFGQQQNTTNIFQQSTSTQNNGTLFNQQQNTSSIFRQKTGNIFAQQQTGSSIFGGQNNGSIFGQQNSAASGSSIFGQANSFGSIFGQQNNPTNTIGQQNASQTKSTPFGQPSSPAVMAKPSIFGQQNTNSIFAQQNPTQNNGGSIFGGQNTTNIFGKPNNVQGTGSIFAQQNNPQSTGNVFGQQKSVQSGENLFGMDMTQNSNIFQAKTQTDNNQQTSSVFGANNVNFFTGKPVTGVFGNAQQTMPSQQTYPQNTVPQSGAIFAKNPEPTNLVMNQNANSLFQAPSGQQPTSIFGLSASKTPLSTFNSGNPSKEKIKWEAYSKLEDLTEDEVNWFNSDIFDIEKIPEKPPAYEMCF